MTAVQQPRLPDALEPMPDPVIDHDVLWENALITGPVTVAAERAELVEISGCHLQGAQLTGCELERAALVDVVFDDCELSGALFLDARFTRVQFNRCRMSGFVASGAVSHDVVFTDCKLDGANFRMSTWDGARWERCELPSAEFVGATLRDAQVRASNLANADVTKLKGERLSLHGSDVTGLRGADALRGAVIGSDQIVPLALPIFAALGITVDDEADDHDGEQRR